MLRAVAPDDLVGLGERRDLVDPGAQGGIGGAALARVRRCRSLRFRPRTRRSSSSSLSWVPDLRPERFVLQGCASLRHPFGQFRSLRISDLSLFLSDESRHARPRDPRPPHPPLPRRARADPRPARRRGGPRRQPALAHRERQARAEAVDARRPRGRARRRARRPARPRGAQPRGPRSSSSSAAPSRARSTRASASRRSDPGRGITDETLEAIVGLHRELQRRASEAIATPEEARRANTDLRERMRDRDNYLPDIEQLAEEQVRASGHRTGALTHREVSVMAERLGFQLIYVNDLPDSTRSITDLANGRIYLPPASIPGGHGLRSMALQAMAHRLLGHTPPGELRRVPLAAARDQLLRGRLPDAAGGIRRVPAAGQEGEAPRDRGLPRRVRRDPRGGGAALHEPRHEPPRHDRCTSCGSPATARC